MSHATLQKPSTKIKQKLYKLEAFPEISCGKPRNLKIPILGVTRRCLILDKSSEFVVKNV